MKYVVLSSMIGMSVFATGTVPANAGTSQLYGYDTSFDKCWARPIHRPFECPPIIYNPR